MLRMTVHDNPGSLTVQLDGRLAGPWVQELESFWWGTRAGRRGRVLRVDLTGLAGIDAAGKAFLAAVYRQGADFVAADRWAKAIGAEMTDAPPPPAAAQGDRPRPT
jgi:ABC-type transporter Mla MlaB component